MVGEGGEVYVVIHVDGQRFGEALGGVLPAFIGEGFGTGSEIGVEDGVESAFPGGRKGSVSLRGVDYGVEVGFQHGGQFVEIGLVGSVVETGIYLERHDSVLFDPFGDVVRGASLGEIEFAVQADVLHGLVHERMADDPHFGEVHFGASGSEDLAFEHRHRGVAPAGSAAVLVLDGRRADDLAVGEAIPLCGVGILCRGSEGDPESQCGEDQVFHRVRGYWVGFRYEAYFLAPATIFRHASRVSSSGFTPLGIR